MSEPLSEAWRSELAERLAGQRVGEAGTPALRLGLRVTDEDGGTLLRFTVVLGAGAPGALVEGEEGRPEVVLVESAETARRLAGGAPIAEELSAGSVKIEGDVQRLVAADKELAALAAALAWG